MNNSADARFNDFLASYTELMGWVRLRIFAEQDVDNLLTLARFYGALRWANFSGTYHDNEVETYVASRVRSEMHFRAPAVAEANNNTVLIASELHDSGGHSRVVLNWLTAFKEDGDHSLVITRSLTKRIEKSLIDNGIAYHLCTARGIGIVAEILTRCINARRIVLHIHPDDIISATVVKLLATSGKQIIFYNHADHVFSYGISYADVVGEVSRYGIALNQRMGRAGISCYLGIPISGIHSYTPSLHSSKRMEVVLSCGASYKYTPSDEVFFGDFVERLLLQRPDVIVLLVGPTGHEPWWAGHVRHWGDRVRFLGELTHEQYIDIMANSDVYVDSFPVTGGTAFPEALLNGKLVAGLQNPIQGYSPVDELRANSIDGLVRKVINLLDRDTVAIKGMECTRLKAIEAHSLDNFRSRVQAMYAGEYLSYPWDSFITVDLYYLEREWRKKQDISFSIRQLIHLPFAFGVTFMFRLYSIQKGLIRSLLSRFHGKFIRRLKRMYPVKL